MDGVFGKEYVLKVEQSDFLVCLATIGNNGRADLRHVTEIKIDDDEIHFLTQESGTQSEPINVLAMQRWFENQRGSCVSASWYGVTRAAAIEGGGTVQFNEPIIGTYWPPRRNELWLLMGTDEEWSIIKDKSKASGDESDIGALT